MSCLKKTTCKFRKNQINFLLQEIEAHAAVCCRAVGNLVTQSQIICKMCSWEALPWFTSKRKLHDLGCISLRNSTKLDFSIRKNPTKDFAFLYWTDHSNIFGITVHQRNRRIHSGSGFFGSLDTLWSKRSWIDLSSKEMQNLFSNSFRFKNPILDFLKEMYPFTH